MSLPRAALRTIIEALESRHAPAALTLLDGIVTASNSVSDGLISDADSKVVAIDSLPAWPTPLVSSVVNNPPGQGGGTFSFFGDNSYATRGGSILGGYDGFTLHMQGSVITGGVNAQFTGPGTWSESMVTTTPIKLRVSPAHGYGFGDRVRVIAQPSFTGHEFGGHAPNLVRSYQLDYDFGSGMRTALAGQYSGTPGTLDWIVGDIVAADLQVGSTLQMLGQLTGQGTTSVHGLSRTDQFNWCVSIPQPSLELAAVQLGTAANGQQVVRPYYYVKGQHLPYGADVRIAFFWGRSPTSRISDVPAYTHRMNPEIGTYWDEQFPLWFLGARPNEATHIIAVADPDNLVTAADPYVYPNTPKTKVLALNPTLAGSVVVAGTTDGTLYMPSAVGSIAVRPFGPLNTSVRTATADVDGDGTPDSVAVTGPGVPIRLAVVSGRDGSNLVAPFDPFGNFSGGGFVTAADFDGDGKPEFVVTPDQGGGPRVSVYSLVNGAAVLRANFFTIDPDFRGGCRPGTGDINGDGVPDLAVSAGFLGGPRIALLDGRSLLSGTPTRMVNDFFAFEDTLRNGAYVAIGDVDGDGYGDLVFGGGPGGGPRVLIISGKQLLSAGRGAAFAAPLANFFVANNGTDRSGVRVATKNTDGDNKADVVVGTGAGVPSRVRVYPGSTITPSGEPAGFLDFDPFRGAILADGVFVG